MGRKVQPMHAPPDFVMVTHWHVIPRTRKNIEVTGAEELLDQIDRPRQGGDRGPKVWALDDLIDGVPIQVQRLCEVVRPRQVIGAKPNATGQVADEVGD